MKNTSKISVQSIIQLGRVLLLSCILLLPKLDAQIVTLISSDDKKPIQTAHIMCKSQDGRKDAVFLTDANGKADLSSFYKANPVFNISISLMGFEKVNDQISTSENRVYYLVPAKNNLNEFVVTAQYAPNSPEKAVHKIRIIDNVKIQAMAAQNLSDVLSNELNIRLSQDNILGSSMSIQGISGQNVKLLIDGVPVTGRLNGNIDISQINMNNVERIEIIEGPLSVSYGTDALGGTINIITKKTQKQSVVGSINTYYESNGQYNTTGKLGFSKNKNTFSIAGGRHYFDGWRTTDRPFYVEKTALADSLRFKNWKPKEQYFGTIFYGHYFNNLKFGYTGDYFYEKVSNRGLPLLPYYETAFDDYYTTYRIKNSLSLAGKLNNRYYLNLIGAHTNFKRIKNTYYNDLTTLDQVLTENSGDQDTSTFDNFMSRGTISSTKDSSKINYEVGYDINHEIAGGIRISNKQHTMGDYALFSSAEYTPNPRMVIRPGVRVMYNTVFKAPIIPSLNIKYSFPLSNGLSEKKGDYSVRFSYARGFRSPSLKEMYFYFVDVNHNIVGNPSLTAEQSNNFSLSTSYNRARGKKAYKSEISVFYNAIDHMISLAQINSTEYSYFNLDKYKTMGAQLQNEYAFRHLKISLGASYIGRYNQLSTTADSEKFLFSPEARANIFYEWHKQNMTFAFFYKYTGSLQTFGINEDNEVYKSRMQDYHMANATISKLFYRNKFNVGIGVKNLFNVTSVTGVATGGAHTADGNSVSIGMGRTYFLKVDINLNSKQ